MKKIFAVVLSIVMVLFLVACGSTTDNAESTISQEQVQSALSSNEEKPSTSSQENVDNIQNK